MEVEEMIKAGILVPSDEEEEEGYLAFRRYYEWNKKVDRELREKGDLE